MNFKTLTKILSLQNVQQYSYLYEIANIKTILLTVVCHVFDYLFHSTSQNVVYEFVHQPINKNYFAETHQPLDQFLSTRFALLFRNFLFLMHLNIDTPHNPLRPCSRSCLLPKTHPQNFSIPFRHMIIRHKSNVTSGTVLGRNAVPQYFFKFLCLSLTAENCIEYWENIYLDTAPHLDTISYLL